MSIWDAQSLQNIIRSRGVIAQNRITELKQKIQENESYKELYDEKLGEQFLLNCLEDSASLSSQKAFLQKLDEMKSSFRCPSQKFYEESKVKIGWLKAIESLEKSTTLSLNDT